MDIDQLKLILDALSNAGDNAMTFALLWELMERLSKWSGGNWRLYEVLAETRGNYWNGYSYGTELTITDQPTLAEAVFAAAVMQAEQEGK